MYPIMLQRLFLTCGFGWGVRISGFICLALCAVACCTVSSRLRRARASAPWFDMRHLRDEQFVLLTVGSVFISLGKVIASITWQHRAHIAPTGLFIPNFYIVSYAIDRGVSPDTAFYVLAVLNAGGILGRIAPAMLSDAAGRFNILVPAAALTGLCTLLGWTLARGLPGILLYAALYGFCSGAFNALILPCIAQVSRITEIGARIGLLYSVLSFP